MAVGALLVVALAIPTSAAAAVADLPGAPLAPAVDFEPGTKIPASLLDADGPVDVFIQTTGEGALSVQQSERDSGSSQRIAASEASEVAEQNERVAIEVADQIADLDPDAEVLYTSSYSVPGVAVTADAASLAAIVEREDVLKVSRIVAQSLELPDAEADASAQPRNSASDALTRAVDTWQQTGRTGRDVTVAVIDTGVDYTHATFGGPGTEAAYATAIESTDAPEASWFDSTKYLGGWDFVGSTYNGAQGSPAYNPVPRPDANPLDGRGGGHGTHVAGTAVGFGIDPDGATFRGDYTALTSETVTSRFSVGPGAAPEAGLIALKVFGDGGGSTALTGAAIEWVAKEVASGTRIDVVNLSLGTDHGAVDDPDNTKLAALMDAGVLAVVAAGNAGDTTDIAGSPGTSERVLTVAASASGNGLGDAVYAYTGDPATTTAREMRGQYSQNYFGDFSATASVVRPQAADNADGCAAFDATDAAAIAGNIVWLAWSDADPACGSGVRFTNAADAGAVGVLLESQTNVFEAGISGNNDIPGAQLTADAVAELRPALEAGSLVVRLDSTGRAVLSYFDSGRTDTAASFTSRGVHGSLDYTLKPDVSAPGVSIVSAARGTGTGRIALSGTSMATPHTAGIAALVTEAHPEWSADRVKQQIMNTAVHDVTTTGANRIAYGPARVGTGRVDALAAVTTGVGMRSVENGELISASFGVVDAAAATSLDRTIRIDNTEDSEQTLALRYSPRTQTPGVVYELSADSVTVPAGGSVDVTLTMRIDDPAQLRRTLDRTMSAMSGGAPRQYLADASGVIEAVRQGGRPPIRLAVFVAPRPVSETRVSGIAFDSVGRAEPTTGTLTNEGRGLEQGEGSERYRSLMVPLVLGATDPDDTFPAGSAVTTLESSDILAVGASSTAPLTSEPSEGMLTFGVVMDGDWASMSPLSYPMVQLDVNGDTRSDFVILVQAGPSGWDLPLAVTVDSVTGETVDQRPVNGAFGDQSTNIFDNNVLTLSTSLAQLGYTPGTTATTVRYVAQTRSYYNPGYDETYRGTLVDQTSAATLDVYAPPLTFGPSVAPASTFTDAAGTIPVTRTAGSTAQALVLHLHGARGERSQIITPTVPAVVSPGAPSPGPTTQPGAGDGSGVPRTDTDRGARGTLARTGGDATAWLAVGGVGGILVAVGAAVMVLRRRGDTGRAR